MKKYDLLVVGATALGCGVLNRYSHLRCAVIQQDDLCGGEFSHTFRPGQLPSKIDTGAEDLYEELVSRGAVDEDSIWAPALSPIMAVRYLRSGADCYFSSAITGIESDGDQYVVSFSTFGCRHTISASFILDTTSDFLTHGFFGFSYPHIKYRWLHYFTDAGTRPRSFPLDAMDIQEGRLALYRKLEAHPEEKLLLMAHQPDLVPSVEESQVSDSCAWLPSAARDTVIDAYAAGSNWILPDYKYIKEKKKLSSLVPAMDRQYDIIVVGLGTAGSIAALSAAKRGMRVLGIEKLYYMGGAGTAGGVMGYYYGIKGGYYRSVDETAEGLSGLASASYIGSVHKMLGLDKISADLSLDCQWNSHFCNVIAEGKKVIGIEYMRDGALHRAYAPITIDASADSLVCMAAGCQMLGGRESDGRFQPFSSVFYKNRDGELGCGYADNGRVNQYDPLEYGYAVLKSACSYIHLLDDYSTRTYLGIAPLLGLREGYRILGDETVRFTDLVSGHFAKKPVYYGWSNLDNHGKDSALEDRAYQDWITIAGLWGYNITIPVPMGALIPRGWDGLLVAGRNVSCDHDIAQGLRMKDDVQKSGEAAAAIAYFAWKDHISCHDVSVDRVRELLAESGCLDLKEMNKIGEQHGIFSRSGEVWSCSVEEIEKGLNSETPGFAIWSTAYACREKAHEEGRNCNGEGPYFGKKGYCSGDADGEILKMVKSVLTKGSEIGKNNAALALALTGDRSCENHLIRMASDRSGYIPSTSWMYNTSHALAAISALGRIRSVAAVDMLLSLLEDETVICSIPVNWCEFFYDREDLYFQYAAHIVAALIEIAPALSETQRANNRKRLHAVLDSKTLRVSMMYTKGIKYDASAGIKKMIDLC